MPQSFRGGADAEPRTASAGGLARPNWIYPAATGLPLRYANGGASGAGLRTATRTLVLYGGAAEVSATKLANLVSHFGGWTARPVATYRTGEVAAYNAVFYVDGPAGAAPPPAFLDDVLRTSRPVMWVGGDIGQLSSRGGAGWTRRYGFVPQGTQAGPFARVDYKGTALPMSWAADIGITRVRITDAGRATVLGTAVRTDGDSLPWAVRSGNLLHVAENPLPYIAADNDRYVAFADLLFEALAPGTAQRHRALIRLEDVGPAADPAQLRAVTDYLHGQGIPFSVGVFPVHRDPNGKAGDATIRLSERPLLVEALRHAAASGGTVLMHGYTHQYADAANPGDGLSGEDAEFYRCHLDARHQSCVLDGPVAEDSTDWALGRIDRGLEELRRAGLPRPSIFEFPHYMASPSAYAAAGSRFPYRYERSLYFPGLLSRQPIPDAGREWQFFPYAVRDVYGATVLPENLNYVTSTGDSIPGMLDAARANLVVRDGVASFFYHPFLGVGELPRLVDGLRAMGYTFVSPADLVAS
ncbi:DUF2334 domain-containing protein [Actinoplanes sp. URMC 104]|uniref:DUF2334 domain-containing protein n=1 Tax=Actinoplanes sp. URMC 104 TaxID=3423409 RepID=UPI003F194E9A